MGRSWIAVCAIAVLPFVVAAASWVVITVAERTRRVRALLSSMGPTVVVPSVHGQVAGAVVLVGLCGMAAITIRVAPVVVGSAIAACWVGRGFVSRLIKPRVRLDVRRLDAEIRNLLDEAA
ncbi:MAG: hypothetical protein OEX04_15630 [Acidimicrobiia bacterium]|nr:hypothetical protein [Acidimicrobiia bacterium]MDH4308897.1 hypothetical protein [Acidimicrobiia bacterium]